MMSGTSTPKEKPQKTVQPGLPEWEVPTRKPERWSACFKATKERIHGKFDRQLPDSRKYFGLRRRSFLLLLLGVLVLFLALLLGLSIGLSLHIS